MPFFEVFSLILAAASAPTETTTVATQAAAAAPTNAARPANKPKQKRICRDDPRYTGTRIAKRICKTQDQWDQAPDSQELQLGGAKTSGG